MSVEQKFNQQELNLILNAVQQFKLQQEKQLSIQNQTEDWNSSEQATRTQILDTIEEKLFELLN